MVSEFELRLRNSAVPDGEVRLGDLAALAGSLQELSLRVGRYVVERAGPGRSPAAIESLADLRLKSIDPGSARLHIVRGSPDELDLDTPQERERESKFWEVISGIATSTRPEWTSDLVAESARHLIEALQHAAGDVTFVRQGEPQLHFNTAVIRREPWQPRPATRDDGIVISGVLRAVDIDRGRFRIRDDVGNRIPLEDVADAERAAHLINRRVVATGMALRADNGAMRAVSSAVIVAEILPKAWFAGSAQDWTAELEKPGPDPEGGITLTDEEFQAFVSAMGR